MELNDIQLAELAGIAKTLSALGERLAGLSASISEAAATVAESDGLPAATAIVFGADTGAGGTVTPGGADTPEGTDGAHTGPDLQVPAGDDRDVEIGDDYDDYDYDDYDGYDEVDEEPWTGRIGIRAVNGDPVDEELAAVVIGSVETLTDRLLPGPIEDTEIRSNGLTVVRLTFEGSRLPAGIVGHGTVPGHGLFKLVVVDDDHDDSVDPDDYKPSGEPLDGVRVNITYTRADGRTWTLDEVAQAQNVAAPSLAVLGEIEWLDPIIMGDSVLIDGRLVTAGMIPEVATSYMRSTSSRTLPGIGLVEANVHVNGADASDDDVDGVDAVTETAGAGELAAADDDGGDDYYGT